MIIPDDFLLLPALSYVEDLITEKRVLVFGKHAGRTALKIAPAALEVTVTEPSNSRIRYMKHRCAHKKIKYVATGLSATGLPAGSFDIILGHLAKTAATELPGILTEMSRVLHDEGLLVLTLPRGGHVGASLEAVSGMTEQEIASILNTHFPHVEFLEESIELCVFVGRDRRRLPTFQLDKVDVENQYRVPIALCSRIPIVPEERLLARFPIAPLAAFMRRRFLAHRRRIRAVTRDAEEHSMPLEPPSPEDLAGVLLDAPESAVLPDESSLDALESVRSLAAVEERTSQSTSTQAEHGTDDQGDPEEEITISSGGEPGKPAGMAQASDSGETAVPSATPMPGVTQDTETEDPAEGRQHSAPVQAMEEARVLGGEVLDDLDMPSPTEQAPAMAGETAPAVQEEAPDSSETSFPDPLDAGEEADPIPPRRRRLEAAMAAPYEVLDRHRETDSTEMAAEPNEGREDLPPIPTPGDEIRRAFLEQWDAPDPGVGVGEWAQPLEEPATRPPAVPGETTNAHGSADLGTKESAPQPAELLDSPEPRQDSLHRTMVNASPEGHGQPSPRSQRGEQALLQALRREHLDRLPSVTEKEGS